MKNRLQIFTLFLALLVLCIPSFAQDDDKVQALLVTNELWDIGDSAIIDKMESLGYEVTTVLDTESDSTWAEGMDFIYVSSTVSSGNVAGKFKNVPVPVIMIEPYAQDEMGMTLDADSTRHFQPIQRMLMIKSEGHFLAAGLTGEVDAFIDYQIQSGQGYPNENGTIIAEYVPLPEDSSISPIIYGAIYAYEKGALMADTTEAAERRYFAGWNDAGVANLSEDGWKLWQAAIDWCLYKDDDTAVANHQRRPDQFSLAQNYPNPFNPATVISFSLNSAAAVHLTVHNIQGRQITDLANKTFPAGEHLVHFDASDLAAGVYFYQLTVDNQQITRKMTLLR